MQGKKKWTVFLLLLLMVAAMLPISRVKAEGGGLAITSIDYDAETLTVQTTGGDSYLYYSDEKKKTWEWAGRFPEDGVFVLDISWVKKTKDYVMVFKGDKSSEISVTLPQQNKSFKVTYNYMKECLNFTSQDGQKVFWRKADSSTWHEITITGETMDPVTLDAFRRLYARGATLYLRTGAVPGTSASAPGVRPSKEAKFSLKKQASEPKLSVKLPGTVAVTDKMEYQVVGADTWTACSEKTLDIKTAAPGAYYKDGTAGVETRIHVRVAATEKKLPSASATVTVRAQEGAPDGANIEKEFVNASTKKFTFKEVKEGADGNEVVTVEKPSSKNPYEYTVVLKDEQLKDDAKWTAITSESVEINKETAPVGATIHFRKKGRVESTTVWQPESVAYTYTVQEDDYQADSTVGMLGEATEAVSMKEDILYLVKEEGVTPEGTKSLTFNINVSQPVYGDIDVQSITCGGKALKFTSEVSGDKTTVTVTITDTATYEAGVTERDKEQDVKITLKNGEEINKVKLTVLHGASVSGEKEFTVTHGIEPDAANLYTFVVNPGLTLEKTGPEADAQHGKTTVQKLMFRGKELVTSGYNVEQDSATGTCTITLKAAAFENDFLDWNVTLDQEYPVTVVMDNKQEITKGVSVKLHERIKSEKVQSSTIPEGKAEKEISLTFVSELDKIGISSATWNGQNVTLVSQTNGTDITVTIGVAAINSLKFPDGETGLTSVAPIVFKLSDGSCSSLVYQLTLNRTSTPEP